MIASFLSCLLLVTVHGKVALETSCSPEDFSCEAAGHAAKPPTGDVLLQMSKSGLSSTAQGISLEGKGKHLKREEEEDNRKPPQTCADKECLQLIDDVNWNKDDPQTFRNLAIKYEGVKTITCVRGESSCQLSYTLPESSSLMEVSTTAKDFYSIAKSTGTDKVTIHHYETTYQEYLGNYSKPNAKPFLMVEVGFAKGYSARAWHQFLPKAKVHEFDVHCDEAWNVEDTSPGGLKGAHRDLKFCKLHCGDGANAAFLEESLKGEEAPFIVIDDGGHGPEEMKNTFEAMWPKVQPGGLYFIEDLAEAYHVVRKEAFVEKKIKPLMSDLLGIGGTKKLLEPISGQVESIQCREQICVLRKRKTV